MSDWKLLPNSSPSRAEGEVTYGLGDAVQPADDATLFDRVVSPQRGWIRYKGETNGHEIERWQLA